MTFAELLNYIGQHSKYDIMDGDAAETLAKAQQKNHKNDVAGQIISDMFAKSGLSDIDGAITRAEAVTAIGPIRLYFMKDDAPVEGFRLVEDIVHKIDGAFNEEALQQKR
jgi:hypothetical protein